MLTKIGRLKRVPTIVEPTREQWLASTKARYIRLGFKTSGSESFDKQLKMPGSPLRDKHMPTEIDPDDVFDECQICDCKIINDYVDGAVKGAGNWATMCMDCWKKHGIGLGTGRGQHYTYAPNIDKFVKMEG